MLKAQKTQAATELVVQLSGTIDEADNFLSIIGTPPQGVTMWIYCAGIARINSVGVKAWLKYFHELAAKGAKFKFGELSYTLVEQMNMIKGFTAGAPVVSVMAEYRCDSCSTSTAKAVKTEEITVPLAPIKCPKCGKEATFSDAEDEYFAYALKRS